MKRKLIITGAIILVIGLIFINPISHWCSTEIISITVEDRVKEVDKDNVSKYFIYTEGEVFENTDTKLYWKTNSRDVQNALKVGQTFEVKVDGWRWPFFSWNRNIIKIIPNEKRKNKLKI